MWTHVLFPDERGLQWVWRPYWRVGRAGLGFSRKMKVRLEKRPGMSDLMTVEGYWHQLCLVRWRVTISPCLGG